MPYFSPERPQDSFERLLNEIYFQFTNLYKLVKVKPERKRHSK